MRRTIMRRRWRRRAMRRPLVWRRRRPLVRMMSPLRWLFWIPLMGFGGLFLTLLLIFWR